MKENFVHLHLHTEYSLLDGVGKIDDYIKVAKDLGMPALAITDHGNMFGAMEFYRKALKAGIKPIIGMEAYISEFEMEKKEGRNFHLILLAKNEIGYKNLMKISSEAFINGFYYRPRIDKKFLAKHSEGIIALSACMQGEIPKNILDKSSTSEIDKIVKEYIDIFGKENFYIEIQGNGIIEQKELNKELKEVALRNNLKVVATNDTHYTYEGDHTLQEIILCLQTGTKLHDKNRMTIETTELFLKNRKQMLESLGDEYIEAINNTIEIAEKCNLNIEFGNLKFPRYENPIETKNIDDYLEQLVTTGMEKRFPSGIPQKYQERVEYELNVIKKMGYAGYFVVVWDFINFAKNNSIPIGPGRGSAAGSLVSYALKITELDPIKYDLIFERFLNPERISMPDIDIDICQERRQEVIDYVIKKYGVDKVAQIITFGTMKARAAIRDVARVIDMPIAKIDKIAKLIPAQASLSFALKEIPEIKEMYLHDLEVQRLIDISLRLENKVRHASIHAAGLVITENPLTETVPLYCDNKNKVIATQYSMKELEYLGLLKMDFLGLRNLTNIQRTLDYIKDSTGEEINLEKISLEKKEVYELLSKGDSAGVFQLESVGIQKILLKLKPEKFSQLVALLALYRPGPLGSGMVENFIDAKNGLQEIKYPDESLKDVLKETYGVILYQEQVMKIANIMADYSLGEADLLRRAMGKKDIGIMEENREKFVERSVKKGYSEEKALEVFELIEKFAGYGFNKSHSVAYGLISYWTAYLKTFYKKYYYAAVLTSEIGNVENIAYYIEDVKQHKVQLEVPDVNKPASKFKIVGGKIRFALSAIKNISEGMIEQIEKDFVTNGYFRNYEDFVVRTRKYGINKKQLEALIYAGALDSLPGNRKQKIESIEKVLEYAARRAKEDEIQQMNLFGEARSGIESFYLPQLTEYGIEEKLEKEKEFLGFYLSAHPLDEYRDVIKSYRFTSIPNLKEEKGVHRIKTCGILRELKKVITKKTGEVMAVFQLEDYYGKIDVIIFPKEYDQYAHYLLEGKPVYIDGSVQVDTFKGNENKKLVVRQIKFLDEVDRLDGIKTYILLKEEDKEKFSKLKELIKNSKGESPLNFAMKLSDIQEIRATKYKVLPSKKFIEGVINLLGEGTIVIK